MCCSILGQILYCLLILACLALTLAAMFTPSWTTIQTVVTQTINNGAVPSQFGIFQFCVFPGQTSGSTDCMQWFSNLPDYYKTVVICMIIAAIVEVIAVIWNFFSCCACCCRGCVLHPLYILSLIISILLSISVAIFYLNNKDFITSVSITSITNGQAGSVGYSFYLACGALAASILSIFLGIISACVAHKKL